MAHLWMVYLGLPIKNGDFPWLCWITRWCMKYMLNILKPPGFVVPESHTAMALIIWDMRCVAWSCTSQPRPRPYERCHGGNGTTIQKNKGDPGQEAKDLENHEVSSWVLDTSTIHIQLACFFPRSRLASATHVIFNGFPISQRYI